MTVPPPPTVQGVLVRPEGPDQPGTVYLWCEHCRRIHHHGDAGEGWAGGGHRVAHCVDSGSPYARGGYVIEIVAEVGSEVEAHQLLRPAYRRRGAG